VCRKHVRWEPGRDTGMGRRTSESHGEGVQGTGRHLFWLRGRSEDFHGDNSHNFGNVTFIVAETTAVTSPPPHSSTPGHTHHRHSHTWPVMQTLSCCYTHSVIPRPVTCSHTRSDTTHTSHTHIHYHTYTQSPRHVVTSTLLSLSLRLAH
jgi:hypothetical protein